MLSCLIHFRLWWLTIYRAKVEIFVSNWQHFTLTNAKPIMKLLSANHDHKCTHVEIYPLTYWFLPFPWWLYAMEFTVAHHVTPFVIHKLIRSIWGMSNNLLIISKAWVLEEEHNGMMIFEFFITNKVGGMRTCKKVKCTERLAACKWEYVVVHHWNVHI